MDSDGDQLPMVHTPTGTLFSFLLMILSWELTIAMFAAHMIVGPAWLTPSKRWAALGVSTFLSLHYRFWGQRRIRAHQETSLGERLYVTPSQSVLVVAMFIGVGVFATWLFFVHA